jgi:hypothetical protein
MITTAVNAKVRFCMSNLPFKSCLMYVIGIGAGQVQGCHHLPFRDILLV